MKKTIAFGFLVILGCTSAHALDWWLQPTICRLDTTRCYGAITGAGYDDEMWDAVSNCRGMKYICPDATTDPSDREPVLMGRLAIANGVGLNPDYDTNSLNKVEGCFGTRRTASNGAQVSVNGRMVNVYCPGVLDKPDEFVENGEITYDTNHPTCRELAEYGYVATLNGNCYGKHYDQSKYYIECGTGLLPSRLIVLNGAEIDAASGDLPSEKSESDALFNKMYQTSQSQKKIYFKKD